MDGSINIKYNEYYSWWRFKVGTKHIIIDFVFRKRFTLFFTNKTLHGYIRIPNIEVVDVNYRYTPVASLAERHKNRTSVSKLTD